MDVALVKSSDGSKWHRAWVTHADGTSASVKIFIPHDLDHFVIESSVGITHGFWGVFAAGGWRRQSELASARDPRRASTSRRGPDDPLVRQHAPDVNFAEAVVYAIGNMFGDGPNTLEGVRDRLRRKDDPRLHVLADQLDDEHLHVIYEARADALRRWRDLEPGSTLRLTWAPSV